MLYERIKRICFEKGTTVFAVEKKAGLSNGTIRKWNESSPRIESLQAVANALEIDTENLIEQLAGENGENVTEMETGTNGKYKDYQPVTEIIIHIGEKDPMDLSKIRVYVNGEKIKHLCGFKFESDMENPPIMTIEKYPY